MSFWTEVLPPKQPGRATLSPRRRVWRLVLGSAVWWPAVAAFILVVAGLVVVAGQGSSAKPALIIRDGAAPTAYRDGLIDLNTATHAELETLPGIGASRAEAIVQLRAQQPFGSLADLVDRGILSPAQLLDIAELAAVYVPDR